MTVFANFLRSPDIATLNRLAVMGMLANGIDVGPKGVHLRWMFPPAAGIPKSTEVYRRVHKEDNSKYGAGLKPDELLIASDPDWALVASPRPLAPEPALLQRYLNALAGDNSTFNYYLSGNPTQRNAAKTHYQTHAIELLRLYYHLELYLLDVTNPLYAGAFENPGENLANLQFRSQEGKPFNNIRPIGLITMAAQDPNLATMLGLYTVDKSIPDPRAKYDYKVEFSYSGKPAMYGFVLNIGNEKYAEVPALGPVVARELDGKTWEYDNLIDNPRLEGGLGLKWLKPQINAAEEKQRFNEPVLFAVKRNPTFTPGLSSANPDEKLVTVQEVNYANRALNCYTDAKVKRLVSGNYKYEVTPVSIFGQKGATVSSNEINISEAMPFPPVALSVQEVKAEGQPLKQKLLFKFGAAQYFVAPHTKRFVVNTRPDSLVDKVNFGYTLVPDGRKNYSRTEAGDKLFRLKISEDGQFPATLGTLSGDLNAIHTKPYHTVEFSLNPEGSPLPTSRIKKFTINRFVSNNLIEIVVPDNAQDSYEIPASGFVTMIKDPHAVSLPNKWAASPLTVNFIEPKKLTLLSAGAVNAQTSNGFSVRITKVKTIAPIRDRIGGNAITPAFTEIFFTRGLLEQGIFDGGLVKIGATVKPILYQGGGIASSTATPETDLNTDAKKARFARIVVEGAFPAATVGAAMVLTPKADLTATTDVLNPLSGLFVLRFSTPATGVPDGFGDILLKVRQTLNLGEARTKDQILPLNLPTVSNFTSSPGGIEVLVKLNKHVSSLMPAANSPCAFFSQYEVEVTSLIASQPIPAGEAVASTFFAIQSETDGAAAFRRSMLSAPAQYFRANLAVPARPGKPAPCVPPPPDEKAFLPAADLKGYAVNCMTWPLQSDVRYEVYRSLDATLLVQHKNEFLKGVQIAVAGLPVPGTITMTPSGAISEDRETKFLTGVFLTPSIIVREADQFLNGRLEISSARSKNYYEVVVAKIVLPNTITGAAQVFKIQLTLKPVNVQFNIPPATATFKLTFLPNYKVVAKRESVLAALANHPALEKAYSLVSGVPVRTNSFNDMVAARGKNMFFYKIRAISVSEVKSSLSEASMPIYQMDTTPPDEIRELSATSIDNRAMLVWKRDGSGDAKIYRLVRGIKPASAGAVVTSEIELQEPALVPKPFFLINATTIQFNKPLVIPIPPALSRLTSTLPTPATNSFVRNSIRVSEIIGQTSRLMVAADKYAVNYTINLSEKKFVVSSVEFKQKRDAGIFFEVSVNSQVLVAETDYLSYIDDGVDTGEMVAYALIPVKPAGPEPQVKITGLPSKLTAIEIRDYAKPAGIAATRQFIDIAGAASSVFTIKSRCVINITNSGKPAFIRITKQILPSDSNVYVEFINLSDKKRCKDWILISETTASFMDDQLQLDNNVQYKIEFKSVEDIQTDPVIIH